MLTILCVPVGLCRVVQRPGNSFWSSQGRVVDFRFRGSMFVSCSFDRRVQCSRGICQALKPKTFLGRGGYISNWSVMFELVDDSLLR